MFYDKNLITFEHAACTMQWEPIDLRPTHDWAVPQAGDDLHIMQ